MQDLQYIVGFQWVLWVKDVIMIKVNVDFCC